MFFWLNPAKALTPDPTPAVGRVARGEGFSPFLPLSEVEGLGERGWGIEGNSLVCLIVI